MPDIFDIAADEPKTGGDVFDTAAGDHPGDMFDQAANELNRDSFTKARNAFAGGVAESVQSVGKGIERLEDPGPLKQDFRTYQRTMLRAGADYSSEADALTALDRERLVQRQDATAPGRAVQEFAKPYVEGTQAINSETPGNEVVSKAAHAVGGMLPLLGIAAIPVVGPEAAAATGGLQATGDTYSQAFDFYRSQGLSEADAQKKADGIAVGTGLNSAIIYSMLPGSGKAVAEKLLAKQLESAAPVIQAGVRTLAQSTEGGLVMGADSLIRNARAAQTYRPDLTWGQAMEEAAKAAVEGAAATGVVHGAIEGVKLGKGAGSEAPKTPLEVKADEIAPIAPLTAEALKQSFLNQPDAGRILTKALSETPADFETRAEHFRQTGEVLEPNQPLPDTGGGADETSPQLANDALSGNTQSSPTELVEPVTTPPNFVEIDTPKGKRRVVVRDQLNSQTGNYMVGRITVHDDTTGSYDIFHPPIGKEFQTPEEAVLAGQRLARASLSRTGIEAAAPGVVKEDAVGYGSSSERVPSTLSEPAPGEVGIEKLDAEKTKYPEATRQLQRSAAELAARADQFATTLPRRQDGSIDFHGASDSQIDELFDYEVRLSDARQLILDQFDASGIKYPPHSEFLKRVHADDLAREMWKRQAAAPSNPPEFPKAQEAPAPEPGFIEKAVSKLEDKADEASKRIAANSGDIKFGSGPLHELPQIRDWSIIGAAKLARGSLNAAKWSAEMVAHFGDEIKPHLETVYRRAREIVRQAVVNEGKIQSPVENIIHGDAGIDEAARGVTADMVKRGAELILDHLTSKGDVDVKGWAEAMTEKFGPSIHPIFEDIFSRARESLGDVTAKPGKLAPSSTGGKKILVSEAAALREVLRASQKAGAAGVRSGEQSAAVDFRDKIADLKQKLSTSMSKADALREYFKGQEKGADIGAAAKVEEFKMASRWMDAEADNIRRSLVDLVNSSLPVSERGKFLRRILDAVRAPSILSKAANSMQERAAKVASEIVYAGEAHEKKVVMAAIEDLGKKWGDSAQMNVDERRQMRIEMTKFKLLKNSGDLPLDVLQAVHDRMVSLRDIGRSEANVRRAIADWQKEFAMIELHNSKTTPIEKRPEFKPRPGDKETFSMKLGNRLRKMMNAGGVIDRSLLPIDALMDLMGDGRGSYQGWLFKHLRGPADLAFNNVLLRRQELTAPLEKLIESAKLTKQNSERVGVYAQAMQKGGRDRMIKQGITPAEIDKIVVSLTPNEIKAYQLMREAMDSGLGEVKDVMKKLYNIDVKSVENYFPFFRDQTIYERPLPDAPETENVAAAFDTQNTWKALQKDYVPGSSTTEQGFTIERKPGAMTPIKIDAFDVFRQHAQDVSHLIEYQPFLKAAGEMVRDELFEKRYGKVGQRLMADWLDTISRQGGSYSAKRWAWLDTLRRNTSLAIIGFRLGSQFVHLSNLPLVAAHVGPGWYFRGLQAAMTEQGKKFLADSFRESFERAGGEPAQAELRRGPITNASFWIARNIDRLNSQAAMLGLYMRSLAESGRDPESYATGEVDRQAQANALVRARRAVASPLPKDLPMAISRGAGVAQENVSASKAIFQFSNIFLDQWSNIRHDLFHAGLVEKNPQLALKMAAAMAAVLLSETLIKQTSSKTVNAVAGYHPKKEESFGDRLLMESIRRFPFVGPLLTQVLYKETGVPIIDSVVSTSYAVGRSITAKTQKARDKAKIKAATGVASLLGVPGASQVGEVLEKAQ